MSDLRRDDSDNVAVVRFAHAILDEPNLEFFRAQLFHLVDELGRHKLLLDFRNVEYVGSAALGILITLQKKLAAVDGMLVLCDLPQEVLDVFEVTKLDQLFRVCRDSSEVALGYFSAGSKPHLPRDVEPKILPFGPIESE